MYKTTWLIEYEEEEGCKQKVEFIQYHFGKTPKFPSWYMEENKLYTIEMIWNFKLIIKPSIFMKCLFHQYIIK